MSHFFTVVIVPETGLFLGLMTTRQCEESSVLTHIQGLSPLFSPLLGIITCPLLGPISEKEAPIRKYF